MNYVQVVFKTQRRSFVFTVESSRMAIPQMVILHAESIFDFGEETNTMNGKGSTPGVGFGEQRRFEHNELVQKHLESGGVVNHFFSVEGMCDFIASEEHFHSMFELWEYCYLWQSTIQ